MICWNIQGMVYGTESKEMDAIGKQQRRGGICHEEGQGVSVL
jgi:hypothetical protein